MTKDMTQGSPLKLILAFAVPLMLGSLFQQFYNLADTIVVGRFVGVEALAAVGSVGGLNYLVLGFVNGIACGFSIPLAWSFGAKDYAEMRRYAANTTWLSLGFAAVITVVTVALTRNILVWTNTPANIIDLADVYIRTIFAGIPFTMLYNVTSAVMRALGDSKRPLYFLLAASVLNIAMDLACVVLFDMGVFGAAFATVFSQAVAGLGSLWYLMRHYDILRWNREEGAMDLACVVLFDMGVFGAAFATVFSQAVAGLGSLWYLMRHYDILRWNREEGHFSTAHCAKLCQMGLPIFSTAHCAKLCQMGLPMGLQCSITAIGSVVLQAAVNDLGSAVVAAQTAGSRAAQVLSVPLESIGTAMTTYASQNLGAGSLVRVKKGLHTALAIGCVPPTPARTWAQAVWCGSKRACILRWLLAVYTAQPPLWCCALRINC